MLRIVIGFFLSWSIMRIAPSNLGLFTWTTNIRLIASYTIPPPPLSPWTLKLICLWLGKLPILPGHLPIQLQIDSTPGIMISRTELPGVPQIYIIFGFSLPWVRVWVFMQLWPALYSPCFAGLFGIHIKTVWRQQTNGLLFKWTEQSRTARQNSIWRILKNSGSNERRSTSEWNSARTNSRNPSNYFSIMCKNSSKCSSPTGTNEMNSEIRLTIAINSFMKRLSTTVRTSGGDWQMSSSPVSDSKMPKRNT